MDIFREIERFYQSVKGEKQIIGKSLQGRNLYAVKVGEGSLVGIAVYAIHGREWISARLAKEHYRRGVLGSVWLIPLANPDGALLSQVGIRSAYGSDQLSFLSAYSGRELRLWKANARGVDLNVNFDAEWGKGAKNVFRRGAQNYIGERPFCEPESQALYYFTQKIKPNYTISFHTKGEEIYWYFGQSTHTCLRDFRIGQVLSRATGYPLKLARGSVGGYKDWCIRSLGIPSYTVELGDDRLSHPLSGMDYGNIRSKCGDALYALSAAVAKYKGMEYEKTYS